MTVVDTLYLAGLGLKRIVEEIDGAMDHGTWRDERGLRLKDTPEWVKFYNSLTITGEALCEDEGCPHYEIAHICVNNRPTDSQVVAVKLLPEVRMLVAAAGAALEPIKQLARNEKLNDRDTPWLGALIDAVATCTRKGLL
jgi:hypothetical protein